MLQLIGVAADLVVEGEDGALGRFRGRVIAIAMDPGAGEAFPGPSAVPTWLLVADDERPAPVWVGQDAVTGHRLGR
jgi:hypothetical protein